MIFYLSFLSTGFDISCKLSPLETICMKYHKCSLEKIRQLFQYVVCWKCYPECKAFKWPLRWFYHVFWSFYVLTQVKVNINVSDISRNTGLPCSRLIRSFWWKTKSFITFTTLWANSAEDKLIIFLFFGKTGFDIAWNVETCFPRKKEKYFYTLSAENISININNQ